MKALDFHLDTKSLADDGLVEGLAVGYGNLDHGGDIILPGAMTKSLANTKSVPMLMYHDLRRPAGVWTDFQETSEGLLVKGRLSMSTQQGREAHGLVKDGAIGGLSIGYRSVKDRIVGKARHLIELAVHEISLVTVPMNEKALITSVKSVLADGSFPTLPQFEDFLREAGFSKTQAAAIAGKGLSHLLRGEPCNANAADFLSALNAGLSA